MTDYVVARVRKGAPMPSAIEPYVPKEVFMALRNECENARTRDEFHNIIERYNQQYGWGGAVRGQQTDHSDMELIFLNIITLGKILCSA